MIDFKHIARLALAVLISSVGWQTAIAKVLETWPLDYVVLKSQLIVRGRVFEDHTVIVEKAFLGPANPSERLSFTDPSSLSFTVGEDTQIGRSVSGSAAVIFLTRATPTGPWRPTGNGSGLKWIDSGRVLGYHQLENPGPYRLILESTTPDELDRLIVAALEKRSRYLAAVNEADQQKRIQRLLPFLNNSTNWYFWREAVQSLAGMGPVAGSTLRELAAEPTDRRYVLIGAIGESGDPGSVKFLSGLVEKARPILADFRSPIIPDSRRTLKEWQVSLCALARINSPDATLVLRQSMSEWEQADEFYAMGAGVCIQEGLNRSPSPENLRAFEKVYRLYPLWFGWERSGNWASWSSMTFLEHHKFKEAIPLLVEQLDHPDPTARDQALRLLREITGTDLGKSKESWLEWRARHQNNN